MALQENRSIHPAGSPEGATPSALSWYLVHTKPRQEEVALENLERQGYAAYLPRLTVEKIRRNKAQWVREAMFPRYLFVQLDTSGAGLSWAPIRSTLGVSRLVHFGSQPARADERLVELLQSREQDAPAQALFSAGDSVVVTQGPFAGIEAIYQTTDAEQRAIILLEIMSRPVSLPIDAGQLRKSG